MQKARVAPRSIKFQDIVQVKEIPSENSHISESSRRKSWEPNLNNSQDFFKPKPTKQRNVIIGIVVCGVVLLAAIIGTVLGVVLSQKITTVANNSLSYNSVCTTGSNQCISSKSLYCSNGFCSCLSPYSWNPTTATCTLLTYNQACSTSNQCDSSLGLNCTNLLCQCDSYHTWNSSSNTCAMILNNTLTYGNQCVIGSSQCNSLVGLNCTGNCTCMNSKVWNMSNCVCPAGTFLNSSNLCQPAFRINQSCLMGSNQCDSTRNLFCNNSFCQCDYSTQYWNFNNEICLPRVNYSGWCSLDGDCIPTLICPTVSGVCTCPTPLPDYVCNCPNTKYYDPTISQCVNRASINGTCTSSANYTCLISLYCNAGTCACRIGTSWIVANSTCA